MSSLKEPGWSGCLLDNRNWISSKAVDISFQLPTETGCWIQLRASRGIKCCAAGGMSICVMLLCVIR
jgi:hypothetical protein